MLANYRCCSRHLYINTIYLCSQISQNIDRSGWNRTLQAGLSLTEDSRTTEFPLFQNGTIFDVDYDLRCHHTFGQQCNVVNLGFQRPYQKLESFEIGVGTPEKQSCDCL